jgi:hypothetical protein
MSKKEVIYIDIEDDITAIIDKVKLSKAEIVAIVPPKRSTVLQSAVNMKLLKRIADKDNKKVVLISNEASLMPLAGGVGLFMADSLQSRPKIPEVEKFEVDDSVIEEDDYADEQKAVVAGAAVGATAVAASKKSKKPVDAETQPALKSSQKNDKIKSLKSGSKIPNFSKFRLRMILGIVGVMFAVLLWFLGFRIFPTANVVVQAQTSRVPVDTSFVANVNASTNIDQGILKADQQTLTKAVTEEFEATGEKDVGEKAGGTMTVQNCDSSSEITVPAGTKFTDPSTGFVFTSNRAVSIPGGSFSGGGCSTPGESDVSVTAEQSGDEKNLSPRSYRVGGFAGTVTGFGSQMSGGTTKKVKVVSQADIDAATKKINERSNDAEKQALADQFSDSTFVIEETFSVNIGAANSSPGVDSEASKATLTSQFTFTMLGVKRDDLNQFLEKQEKQQLGDQSNQSILDTGIDDANISILTKTSSDNMTVGIKTNGYAGPEIEVDSLKEEIRNKRYSEAINIIEDKDGVSKANIELSPFWVSHVPGRTSKINVEIEVSDSTLQ